MVELWDSEKVGELADEWVDETVDPWDALLAVSMAELTAIELAA